MPELIKPLLLFLAFLALLGVVLEELIHVSKAKVTLLLGTLSWVLLYIFKDASQTTVQSGFAESISEIASLWLFLVSAMTFVAYLNKKGLIEHLIYLFLPAQLSERKLLLLTGVFCLIFSSLADNITATLVSVTLILSLKLEPAKLMKFATLVVFAVNSGGVALITGDVTTLMIFLAGKVSIVDLFVLTLPALIAVILLTLLLSIGMNGTVIIEKRTTQVRGVDLAIGGIFLATILSTILGNVFFGIPPVLTFLTALSLMFLVARFFDEDNDADPILEYIRRIEFETLLFFLGILLLVGALKEVKVLESVLGLYDAMPAVGANYVMGLVSALIDNVPLTAALLKSGIEMSKAEWMGLTYSVGVGGSLLIIGSAAGVVAMSKVEGLTFRHYAKQTPYLLLAYSVGYAGVFFMESLLG